jgi:hypothetical protein
MCSLPNHRPAGHARRPAVKPEIEARLGPVVPGVHTLFIHRGEECFGYYIRRLFSDFGFAFELTKFGAQGSGCYCVLLDGARSSCECKGFLRWGHCKHVTGLGQLWRAGRLDHIPEDLS